MSIQHGLIAQADLAAERDPVDRQDPTEAPQRSAGPPGVFLDLNGTLVLPVTPTALADYEAISCCVEAVALLCDAGFVCPVVTVQSRIAKGLFSGAEFERWFQSFRALLASQRAFLEGPYVCPHRYNAPCGCKKPQGTLHRRAAAALGIDVASSFIVGDSLEDVQAARSLGCRSVLVRTGWPTGPDVEARASHVSEDVLGAAGWIVAAQASDPTAGCSAHPAGAARR